MSIQRRVNWISQQRVDVPDMRSVESAVSNDFDQLVQAFATGTSQGYIIRGFEILMAGAVGGASNGLQVSVDPGAVFHISSKQSGTVFMVPSGTSPQVLNGATNTNVVGAFAPSSINYVGLEYTRFIDPTTDAQVYIWDPSSNSESTLTAPRAQILTFQLTITTGVWASNVLPIAIVQTDAGNNVLSITDSRGLFCRLGKGGSSPNPFFVYPWNAQTEGRTENPPTSSNNAIDPFHGGDKMLGSLKDWMDAVMSSIKEIKGTTFWYTALNGGLSLAQLLEDLGNTVVTSQGSIAHGVLPNTFPVLATTGSITQSSDQLTGLASTTGIVDGQFIFGTGIPYGTTVLNLSGSTVTMSNQATLTNASASVQFFADNVITAPGQVNWDKDIFFRVIGSRLVYRILANPSSADITLNDNLIDGSSHNANQVAYLSMSRDVAIIPNLIFTNGSSTVQSVGAVSWTTLLQAGDWIRQYSDTDALSFQIKTIDSLSQVTLGNPITNVSETYGGTSTGISGAKAVYSIGTYYASASPSGDPRAIQLANKESVPKSANSWWFLMRSDSGGATPIVYVRFIGQELQQGDTNQIDDGVPRQMLEYIGSPAESAYQPQYVSSLNPGSIVEIQDLTFGDASTISSNEYFYIGSSDDTRKYYPWFNKDGTGVDPMPAADRLGVEIAISTGQTSAQIATAAMTALNAILPKDFDAATRANPNQNVVRVTNTSAGACTLASNGNVGAPFAVSLVQAGTGLGNHVLNDGDNLTLASKKLDDFAGDILRHANDPKYDEPLTVVPGSPANSNQVMGPVSAGTNLTLPLNSRESEIIQRYIVGKGDLEVFLNGQQLELGADWLEVGTFNTFSTQVTIEWDLVVGDEITFRITKGGGAGGAIGPAGPTGAQGPPGADAAGGPVAISTKTSNYGVLLTDCFLKADCSSGSVTFTLPSASSATGRIFYFKKIDSTSNNMIIMASGLDTVDGLSTQVTSIQYTDFAVISDGSTWSIF